MKATYSLTSPPPTELAPGGYVVPTPYNTTAGKQAASEGEGATVPVAGIVYMLEQASNFVPGALSWFAVRVENPYPNEKQNLEAIEKANAALGNSL